MAILSNRARNSLKSQRKPVEVHGTIGEVDIVLTVVASGTFLGQRSVCPNIKPYQLTSTIIKHV